jgi:hypothetical protein
METNMTQTKPRVAKWKAGLAALALGALLVVPSAGAEDGTEDSTEIDFSITGGSFTAALSDGEMANVNDYSLEMSTTGSVNVAVEDLRGGDGNWTVSLEADPFVHSEGSGTGEITADNLSAAEPVDPDDSGLNSDANMSYFEALDLSSASEIAAGANAHGTVSWTNDLTLDIPEATQAGEYTSTLYLTSNIAPGVE